MPGTWLLAAVLAAALSRPQGGGLAPAPAGTGSQLQVAWRHRLLRPAVLEPSTAGGLVVYAGRRRLVVLDGATGEVRCRLDLRVDPRHRPAVTAGRVLVPLRGPALVAIDRRLWREAWRIEAATSVPPVAAGAQLVVGTSTGKLRIVEAATGRILHDLDLGDPVVACAAGGGVAYAGTGGTELAAGGEVTAVDPEQGRSLWTTTLEQRVPRALAATGSGVCVFASLEVKTRDLVGDRIVVLGRAKGHERWRFDGGPRGPACCTAGLAVVAAHDGNLHGLALADGEERWTLRIANARDLADVRVLALPPRVLVTVAGVGGGPGGALLVLDPRTGKVGRRVAGAARNRFLGGLGGPARNLRPVGAAGPTSVWWSPEQGLVGLR